MSVLPVQLYVQAVLIRTHAYLVLMESTLIVLPRHVERNVLKDTLVMLRRIHVLNSAQMVSTTI